MPDKRRHKDQHSNDGKAKTGSDSEVFVSSDRRGWLTLMKKQWLLIGAVLLLIVAGGVYLSIDRLQPEPESPVYTEEGVRLRKLGAGELQDEVEKLAFEDKYSSAQQLINYQDNADNERLQQLLASVFINQEKYDQALKVFLYMEKNDIGTDWQVVRNIAEQYEELGVTQDALTYYRKALELLRPAEDVPVKNDQISTLERRIKNLQEGR